MSRENAFVPPAHADPRIASEERLLAALASALEAADPVPDCVRAAACRMFATAREPAGGADPPDPGGDPPA